MDGCLIALDLPAGRMYKTAFVKLRVDFLEERKMAKIAVREPMAPGADLVEKFKNLAEMGIDGIELVQSSVKDAVPQIKKAMAEVSDVKPVLTSCGGACLVDPRKEEREAGLAMLIEGLEVAAEVGAGLGCFTRPSSR